LNAPGVLAALSLKRRAPPSPSPKSSLRGSNVVFVSLRKYKDRFFRERCIHPKKVIYGRKEMIS
jgi:hypothetical protein